PAVDVRPASLSPRWIGGVLRGDLGFQGAVFADDLSMAGAAALGDIVARAALAREAGCDVLPVCNDPAAAQKLLDSMRGPPDPVSRMRLVRLHGRESARGTLSADPRWQTAVAAVRELTDPPALRLEPERPA
ncbi:MAG: glycoside hydrolase family 3 N-terminal domain-containing protein, partial [Steroidobacteraceae bacterium]